MTKYGLAKELGVPVNYVYHAYKVIELCKQKGIDMNNLDKLVQKYGADKAPNNHNKEEEVHVTENTTNLSDNQVLDAFGRVCGSPSSISRPDVSRPDISRPGLANGINPEAFLNIDNDGFF